MGMAVRAVRAGVLVFNRRALQITKALVLRGHELQDRMLTVLVEVLADDVCGIRSSLSSSAV